MLYNKKNNNNTTTKKNLRCRCCLHLLWRSDVAARCCRRVDAVFVNCCVAVVVACGAATMLSTAVVQPDRQGVCKLLRFCCCDALGFCSFGCRKKTYVAVAVCTYCGAATMLPAAVVALMLCS